MNDALGAILVPKLPAQYDAKAVDDALFIITTQIERMTARGRILGDRANINNLPTSATGLTSGDLWRNGTTVSIVP